MKRYHNIFYFKYIYIKYKEYELFHHLLMKTTKKKDELNHLLNEDYNDIHHLEEKRKRCFEMSLEYYQNVCNN